MALNTISITSALQRRSVTGIRVRVVVLGAEHCEVCESTKQSLLSVTEEDWLGVQVLYAGIEQLSPNLSAPESVGDLVGFFHQQCNGELASKYGRKSLMVPTLLLTGGKHTWVAHGYHTPSMLERLLNGYALGWNFAQFLVREIPERLVEVECMNWQMSRNYGYIYTRWSIINEMLEIIRRNLKSLETKAGKVKLNFAFSRNNECFALVPRTTAKQLLGDCLRLCAIGESMVNCLIALDEEGRGEPLPTEIRERHYAPKLNIVSTAKKRVLELGRNM